MSDHTPANDGQRDPRPAGPARDFAAFCELDRERRRNSDDDFDPSLFDEAAALVLSRLERPFDPQPVGLLGPHLGALLDPRPGG